jgi:hypothetical protein
VFDAERLVVEALIATKLSKLASTAVNRLVKKLFELILLAVKSVTVVVAKVVVPKTANNPVDVAPNRSDKNIVLSTHPTPVFQYNVLLSTVPSARDPVESPVQYVDVPFVARNCPAVPVAFLPSRSSPVICSLLIVDEASIARFAYKLVVEAIVTVKSLIVVVASVVVPDTPDSILSEILIRLLFATVFVILPSFALSIASRYLNK